jgi:hypothetical protein
MFHTGRDVPSSGLTRKSDAGMGTTLTLPVKRSPSLEREPHKDTRSTIYEPGSIGEMFEVDSLLLHVTLASKQRAQARADESL